jgi:hypothetical protein
MPPISLDYAKLRWITPNYAKFNPSIFMTRAGNPPKHRPGAAFSRPPLCRCRPAGFSPGPMGGRPGQPRVYLDTAPMQFQDSPAPRSGERVRERGSFQPRRAMLRCARQPMNSFYCLVQFGSVWPVPSGNA